MGNDCGVPRLRRPAREDGGGKAPWASSPGYDLRILCLTGLHTAS